MKQYPLLFASNIVTAGKKHISQALFRPSQALIEVTTREAHSELSNSGFYVTNYTRPIPFQQVLQLGNGFSNFDFPPL